MQSNVRTTKGRCVSFKAVAKLVIATCNTRRMDSISYPGPFCESLAITEDGLLGTDELPVLSQAEDLTKGVVYELNLFRQKHDISWEQFEEWIKKLFHKHIKFPSLKALRVSVMRLTEERNKLKRNKKPLDSFFSTTYMLSQKCRSSPS